MGYAGDYQTQVLVDGEVRQTYEPTGAQTYSLDLHLSNLGLDSNDKFITLRVSNGELLCLANPVWLQHTMFGDLDGDGSIGMGDLLSIISAWGGCSNCLSDLDQSGVVDTSDLLTLISLW